MSSKIDNTSAFTWLWFEDEPPSADDIANNPLMPSNINNFQTLEEIVKYLIDVKSKNHFGKVGFIIDVLHKRVPYVFEAPEWNGRSIYHRTQNGYDTGVVFFEEYIMNKSGGWETCWSGNLPPVIFLTVLKADEQFQTRLNEINLHWGATNKIRPEEVKVKWVRKWDKNEFFSLLNNWDGIYNVNS